MFRREIQLFYCISWNVSADCGIRTHVSCTARSANLASYPQAAGRAGCLDDVDGSRYSDADRLDVKLSRKDQVLLTYVNACCRLDQFQPPIYLQPLPAHTVPVSRSQERVSGKDKVREIEAGSRPWK
jgi:hypothetical protein